MKSNDYQCVSKTLRVIGSKWTILILQELCRGTRRFGQLLQALDGISPRTLSLRLKQLEKNGIIHRRTFAVVPLRVDYSLTTKGQSLRSIIRVIQRWGEQKF